MWLNQESNPALQINKCHTYTYKMWPHDGQVQRDNFTHSLQPGSQHYNCSCVDFCSQISLEGLQSLRNQGDQLLMYPIPTLLLVLAESLCYRIYPFKRPTSNKCPPRISAHPESSKIK